MHWLTERVGRLITNFVAVVTFAFFMFKLMPGDTASYIRAQLVSKGYSEAQIERRVRTYTTFDSNEPVWKQYLDYVGNLLSGDLGTSILHDQPVAELLGQALPWTIFLMGTSLILMYLIGIVVGGLMAYIEGSRSDSALSVLLILAGSTPYYLVAILLIFAFAYGNITDLFPSGRRYAATASIGLNIEFLVSVLHHAALPIASMVVTGVGGVAVAMRANSISELGKDYIRVGRLRGLGPSHLATRYIGRNAILPMFTQLVISIATVFSGSVIMEQLFSYPGVGWYLFQGFQTRDIFLMMGGFILVSGATLVSIFVADLTYGLIDPRIGHGAEADRNIAQRGLRGWAKEARITALSVFERVTGRASTDTVDDEKRVGDLPERFMGESTTPRSRRERYYFKLDQWVLAPLNILWDDWRGRFGVLTVIAYVLMGTVGVVLIKPPKLNRYEPYADPLTMAHPFGTDKFGQDLVNAIVHATPSMLIMVATGAVFAVFIATVIGAVGGYLANTAVDRTLMFITDTVMTIPGLVLIIVLVTTLKNTPFAPTGPITVGLLLSIDNWPGLARTVRSEVMSVREESYVEASNVLGISKSEIISRDILPNLMPFIAINFIMAARGIIFESVGLYFLGVLPESEQNWGTILNTAFNNGGLYSWNAAHWLIAPLLTIVLFTIGLTLLSQAADRVFNPQTRVRHAETTEQDESAVAAD